MMARDEIWLRGAMERAETVEECKLAVAVFFAGRSGMPLRPQDGIPMATHLSMLSSRYKAVCNMASEAS